MRRRKCFPCRGRSSARFEPLDVAEHLGLAVVAVEDGVLEEFARAFQPIRNSINAKNVANWREFFSVANNLDQVVHLFKRTGFIQ